MSNIPENINGGIAIIWKIEKFHNLPDTWITSIRHFQWAKLQSKWNIELSIFSRKTNEKTFSLKIEKLDCLEPFSLRGSVFVVIGKLSFELACLDEHNFKTVKEKTLSSSRFFITNSCKQVSAINDDFLFLHMNLWDCNLDDLIAAEYFILSKYTKQQCSFEWHITETTWEKNKNIAECSIDVPGQFLDFVTMQRFGLKFNLRITNNNAVVRIMIKGIETQHFSVHCSFNLEAQIDEGTWLPFLDIGMHEIELKSACWNSSHFAHSITEREQNYLARDLTFKVKIIIVSNSCGVIEQARYMSGDCNSNRKSPTSKKKMLPEHKLQNSLHILYKEGKFCDVMLRSNKVTFNCHKAVLCARSSVFRTMFESNMVEKETNVVQIDDVESRVLSVFLTYLYSDNLEEENFDLIVKLYTVADKYAVLKLQRKCAHFIVSNLSIENSCEVLHLADSHQDEDLKKNILSFICTHIKDIVNSSSWKKLLTMNPALAAETAQDIFTKIL